MRALQVTRIQALLAYAAIGRKTPLLEQRVSYQKLLNKRKESLCQRAVRIKKKKKKKKKNHKVVLQIITKIFSSSLQSKMKRKIHFLNHLLHQM
jgi:hypothetical protein